MVRHFSTALSKKIFVSFLIIGVSLIVMACNIKNDPETSNIDFTISETSDISTIDPISTNSPTTLEVSSIISSSLTSTENTSVSSMSTTEEIYTTDMTTREIIVDGFVSNPKDYLYRDFQGGIELIKYLGNDSLVLVPSYISDKEVLRIDNNAFQGNNYIEIVKLADSILEIGNNVFSSSKNLAEIHLPPSLNFIGENIIQDCTSLTAIIVDENNPYFSSKNGILYHWTNFDNYSQTMSLNDYRLNENETTTDFQTEEPVLEVFIYPSGLTDEIFEIPADVQQIGVWAFSGNIFLKEVIIPSTVTSIGNGAFMNCLNLETISIPESITIINPYTFYGCVSLKNITLSEGLERIGSAAFENCSSLVTINFPASPDFCSTTIN